jgi:hypothetical protein
MADVNRTAARGRDRGQLILVTGLLVAVTMVAMVLLLNTAIYTENLASRGADQSGREALEYRRAVVDGVGGLIEEENEKEHGSFSTVKTDVEDGIDTIDNFTARNYAMRGTVVRINQSSSSMTVTEGKLVRQTTSRQFQNSSGALDDWELATGVEDDEIRDFTVNVSRSSLETNVDHGLTVYLEDSSATTWEAFVYEDGSNVTVATSLNGGSKTDVCTVAASEATVDLTRGEIEGEPCPGLNWSQGLTGDYSVEYRNGENATGTYNVTIADPGGATVHPTNVDDSPSTAVYHVPAVYGVSFEIEYEAPTLTYRTEVRVAPGEPE